MYGDVIALPAGWVVVKPATTAWDGTGAPSHAAAEADLFQSSSGTLAWAYAAPTTETLAARTARQLAADAAEHPCPATPEIDEATTLGGEPARFTAKHCPEVGGILVATSVVLHRGTAYVFYFQHPPNAAPDPNDLAVFRSLLGGVKLP